MPARLRAMIMAAVLVLGSAAAVQISGQAEALLQKAIQAETVDGDLKAAIGLYEKTVAAAGSNRSVAAKALVQMGECYEKLGDAEARKAYQRVVREYADQAEQVKLARARLAALAGPGPTTLTIRRLENPPADAPRGAPSPDGRYLSFWDWRTGDLAVRDLQTGQDRRLTDEGNSWGENVPVFQEAGESVWSPDSKQIAYIWTIGSAVELRIIGLDGGKPRVLSRYESGERVRCFDWSPDRRWILASHRHERGPEQMVLISIAGGSARTLGTTNDESYTKKIRFSPDGRNIVYNALPDDSSPERDIFLLSINNGQVTPLIQHPADDFLLGWSADGKWLAFASDRTGALSLWVVGVAGERTQGTPQLVKAGIGRVLPMGLTRDGALYYGVVTATEDVYVVDLDPNTGKAIGSPRKAIERYEGGNYQPTYSPDGKFLAYVSKRGSNPYPTNAGNTLCIRSLDTGQNREFYREFWRLGLRSILGPQWSPDGRFMTFGGSGGSSGMDVYRIDLETGEITRVYSSDPDEVLMDGGFGPDGKHYLARGDRNKDFSQIVVQDLDTGEELELYRFPKFELRVRIGLSPDGRWLSFLNNGQNTVRSLRIMPAVGGTAREIWSFGKAEGGAPSQDHVWTADGQYILFEEYDRTRRGLWRIPVEGGNPERIGVGRRVNSLTVHPSGRQLAFASRGSASTSSEVWVIENFLPGSEVANK